MRMIDTVSYTLLHCVADLWWFLIIASMKIVGLKTESRVGLISCGKQLDITFAMPE